jgi:alpha-L-fucosidase 2
MIAAVSFWLAASTRLSDIDLAAPIKTWDEALPLGNGEMGALVWGEGSTLRLSLDRGDLWDLKSAPETSEEGFTYSNLRRLVAAKDAEEIARLFDRGYDRPTPTKLPGLRLEFDLAPTVSAERFRLSLKDGVASVETTAGPARFVFDRAEPVLVGEIDAPLTGSRFVPPVVLKSLGYPAASTFGRIEGNRREVWIAQSGREGLQYVAYEASRTVGGKTTLAISFVTNARDVDAAARARRLAIGALGRGFGRAAADSAGWWKRYWEESVVTAPDPAIQAQYDLAMYLYGSGARRGQPPIPLQGLWTADDGGLPPWKGDFHHDLNTQLIYWPYRAAGHFEAGLGLFDFLWSQLPAYRRFSREFFGVSGAAIPGVAALDGSPLGGWEMYSLSPTTGLWLGTMFADHWRTTRDIGFLRGRAYPFCKELAESVRGLLHPDGSGRLVLPLSSSPEVHDNSLAAWLRPNSNFDSAVLKRFFLDLAEMAGALGRGKEADEWSRVAAGFGAPWVDATGLKISADEDLLKSHRHFSHLIAIHPTGLVSVEGPEADRKAILDSLAHLEKLGTKEWCGYSFGWAACLYARSGRSEEALKLLSIYASAFVLRNGFHANGDQSGKGYSNFTYRPFTLEGNFAAAEAVHEMLLQSWGGVVRVFPAVPASWADVSFDRLRAEGGFEVSARRSAGHLNEVLVRASVDGVLNLRTPESLTWQLPDGSRASGSELRVKLRRGQMVRGG